MDTTMWIEMAQTNKDDYNGTRMYLTSFMVRERQTIITQSIFHL